MWHKASIKGKYYRLGGVLMLLSSGVPGKDTVEYRSVCPWPGILQVSLLHINEVFS